MNLYTVNAPVRFHADQRVSIDDKQHALRADLVEVLGTAGDRAVVRLTASQDFKRGEIIGLEEVPRGMAEKLDPVGGEPRAPAQPQPLPPRRAPRRIG